MRKIAGCLISKFVWKKTQDRMYPSAVSWRAQNIHHYETPGSRAGTSQCRTTRASTWNVENIAQLPQPYAKLFSLQTQAIASKMYIASTPRGRPSAAYTVVCMRLSTSAMICFVTSHSSHSSTERFARWEWKSTAARGRRRKQTYHAYSVQNRIG